MGISIAPIGYLTEIESDNATLLLAITLRALQGIASASINTTCYSMAANKYADQTEFVVGMLEAMSGIGIVFGLMGGSVVYETMGYNAVFLLFGSLLPTMAFISRILFKCLDRKEREETERRE